MDDRREELVYRKINQLTAGLIAGGATVVLLIGIVAILLHGQVRHGQGQRAALDRRVAELERLGRQPPDRPVESSPVGGAETQPAPPAPERAREEPSLGRSRELADRLAGLSPDDPQVAGVLAELEALDAGGRPVEPAALSVAAEFELDRGDLESALTWADRALARDGSHRSALLLAAQAAYRLDRPTEARTYVDRALALPGPGAHAQLLSGRISLAAGQADAAEAALQTAKQDPATAAEAALLLARIAFQAGDLDAAAAELDYCDAAEADRSDALRLRAQVALGQQRYQDCISAAGKLVERDGSDTQAGFLLGRALLQTGQPRQAAEQFERITGRLPDNAEAWHLWGTALLGQLRPQEAADRLLRAVEIDPQRTGAWQHLGVARANLDDCPAAVEAFDQALALDPSLAEAHFAQAVCLARSGEGDRARDSLRRAVELEPQFAEQARSVPGLTGSPDEREPTTPAPRPGERTRSDDAGG